MMIRPVLLAALVVCSLGASFVAVQPAAADGALESPLPHEPDDGDGSSTDDETSQDADGAESSSDDDGDVDEEDDEDEERWYDSWESDRENRSDNRTADGDDDRTNETTDDGANSSSAGDDGDGTDEPDGYGGVDEHDGDANESDRNADREDGLQLVPEGLLADETVEWVTERVAGEATDVYRGSGSDTLSDGVPDLADGDRPDAREDRSEAVPSAADDRADRTHDRTAAPAGSDGSAEAEAAQATDSESSDSADDGSADGDREGSEVPEPPSGAGAGVALFVTVGYLGGTRTAVTQANLLATTAPEDTMASLRAAAGEYLPGRPDVVAPAVFGYSRHDSSDPLENDTRAAIYDRVSESPGIYHAQLAEETGVAVETVRYHCRILAEEGLVEPRKHRGKRRIYPVSMDGDDPELGAAMADSAAADVLSAVERLEPVTLSAVAQHVGCAPSTVTYHIDRLEEDGLVTRERDGGAVEVRLRRDARSALQTSVADD